MAKQQKIVLKIPKGLAATEREALGINIISYIQERTLNGEGSDGKAFPGYSKAYENKTGKTAVDLNDTGDMLIGLTLLTHRTGSITIGYPAGDPINGKVEGNRLGTYGQDTPIPGKARDFLKISPKELQSLFADLVSEFELADITDEVEAAENLSDKALADLEDRFWELGDE